MPSYHEWNQWLSSHFFNPENAGLDVLLYITKELIVDIGRKNDLQITDSITDDAVYSSFIDIVKEYNPYYNATVYPEAICTRAYRVYYGDKPINNLILDRESPPPILPYLALFILADVESNDDGIHDNAYYSRLRKLLCVGDSVAFDDFKKMDILWNGLEKWSRYYRKGNYGYFRLLPISRMKYIKYPRSQALLMTDDKDKLPDIFYAAGFATGMLPNEGELCAALLEYGKYNLHKRTLRLLNTGDDVLKERCLELISLEFEEWDGNPTTDEESLGKAAAVRLRANIRLSLETTGNTIAFYLRLFEDDEFPEGGYLLDLDSKKLICRRKNNPRWSTRISTSSGEFYSELFDWLKDLTFCDSLNNYKARFKGKNILVFVKGEKECLPSNEWIEVNSLATDEEFIMLVHNERLEEVKSWGQHGAQWKLLTYCGMPDDWTMFYGNNPSVELKPPSGLIIEKSISMVFEGGVKVGRKPVTHLYIENSPLFIPKIRIHNAPPEIKVLALYSNKECFLESIHGLFKLPDLLPCDTAIRIEVLDRNNQVLKTKNIRFRKPHLAADWGSVPHRNSSGDKDKDCQEYASGAKVNGVTTIAESGYTDMYTRIQRWAPKENVQYTLGKKPGQITNRPLQDNGWDAIWAITNTTVCFLQNEQFLKENFTIENYFYNLKVNNEEGDHLKLWKQLLIECSKKNLSPNLKPVKIMLEKFITFAERLD